MIRRILCLSATFVTLMASSGCDPLGKPSLPVQFGVRVTDGQLRLWTGSPCRGTTAVNVTFNMDRRDKAELKLEATPLPAAAGSHKAPPNPGSEVEYFTVGGPYPGFDVVTPLPAQFDWRTADTVFIFPQSPRAFGAAGKLGEAIKESDRHPHDTYWFEGIGWLNPADVAAQDGRKFLTLCSPDRAQGRHLPRVFGVRVTDGTLRIWPGRFCGPVDDVILTFQPGQTDLVLAADSRNAVPFDALTATGPYPGFAVVRPLPGGFDWRTRKTVLLRVYRTNGEPWTTTTDLGPAVAESGRHAPDTYWFQGFGWLSPAEVADKDGKELLTACAPEPARR
ncbi:hypothetical protein [Mycolicibacterium sp. lyk4-40-TYG-92]|uniref:hypothetical protein n=1 Tax=Mycolicibacterium sp. lyk4-40-TYG-92 TaxID=3040295 RepID=UPI00254DB3C7|nr:hypothetical protein [Mycolicibacterium sp. lyk4-40-TYG-92]